MPTKNSHGLDVTQDLVFQQRDWRVQRVGWGLLALVLAAGLAGLLGPGPLSRTTAAGGEQLQVQYERFVRHGGQTEIIVRIATAAPGPVQVSVGRAYLSAFHLQQVLPAPARVQAGDAVLVYTFEGPAEGGPVELKFFLQPDTLGSHVGRIATGKGSANTVTIRQFTYP